MKDVMTKGSSKDDLQPEVRLNEDGTKHYVYNLDAVKKSKYDISMSEYYRLKAKQKPELSPLEQKQLAKAEKRMQKLVDTFNSIDFMPIAKTIEQFNKVHADRLADSVSQITSALSSPSFAPTIEVLASLQNQQSLIGLQATKLFDSSTVFKSIFSDIQTMHERVFKSIQLDLSSLNKTLSVTMAESIQSRSFDVSLDDEGHVRVKGEVTQTKKVRNISVETSAKVDLVIDKLEDYDARFDAIAVSYTHLTLPTTPYV